MTATPAGVKLHAELSQLLGSALLLLLDLTAACGRAAGPATAAVLVAVMAAAGWVLGTPEGRG
eukprot:101776-Chlamydomonas_euryale.AAC.1